MTTLNLKPGEIFDLPDGRFQFLEEWDDETLWFIKNTGARLPLSETQLVDMMGAGEAKRIDIFKRSDGRPKSTNDLGEFGPGEEFSPEAIRARTLQFFVRQWDDAKGPTLGRRGLEKFIGSFSKDDRLKLLNHKVNSTALYNAIRNCGEPGNRPLRVFRSLRGKTGRKEAVHQGRRGRAGSVGRLLLEPAGAHAYRRIRLFPRHHEEGRREPGQVSATHETLAPPDQPHDQPGELGPQVFPREATLKFEGVKDSLSAKEPLELVIMDHTVIDTFVVFDNEFFLPLGRPTPLTVAIDVATRMILGYLLSFEPASLYSVLSDAQARQSQQALHGQALSGHPGSVGRVGFAGSCFVDSGWEFKSPSLRDSLRDLGTEIIWSPVRTPQYKAVGERFLENLNDRLFPQDAGWRTGRSD